MTGLLGSGSLKVPLHQICYLCPLKVEQILSNICCCCLCPSSSSEAIQLNNSPWLTPRRLPPLTFRIRQQLFSAQLWCVVLPVPFWGKSVLIYQQRGRGNTWTRVNLIYPSCTHFPTSQLFPVLTLPFYSWLTLPYPCAQMFQLLIHSCEPQSILGDIGKLPGSWVH